MDEKHPKRLIHVYSGPGKGKTTASLGLALRACGHGRKVRMICFMKGDPEYGEVQIAKSIPGFELIQSGLPTFVKKGDPSEEDLRLAREGITFVISSSELEELIVYSDRILVLNRGRVAGEFSGESATKDRLILAATT